MVDVRPVSQVRSGVIEIQLQQAKQSNPGNRVRAVDQKGRLIDIQ